MSDLKRSAKMKPLIFALILVGLTPSVIADSAWEVAAVSKIEVLNADFTKHLIITEPSDLSNFIGALSRAKKIRKHSENRKWSHKLDITSTASESGRWLFDYSTGEFTRLSIKSMDIYRIEEDDMVIIRLYFKSKESKTTAPKAPQTMTTAVTCRAYARPAPAVVMSDF
jgi:hypothetical protein